MASYSEIKERVKKQGVSSTYDEIKEKVKNNGVSHSLNADTLNTFLTEARDFLTTANEDYAKVEYGHSYAPYEKRRKKAEELNSKYLEIDLWLESNKKNLDSKTYSTYRTILDDYYSGAQSILKTFKNANDFYNQFDSEDNYMMWKAFEESKDVPTREDFKNFVQLGASVENPALQDTNPLYGDAEEVYNMVTFAETNREDIAKQSDYLRKNGYSYRVRTSPTLVLRLNDINKYMTDDEKAIYNYYVGKAEEARKKMLTPGQGSAIKEVHYYEKLAEQYLNYLQDYVFAQKIADEIVAKNDGAFGEVLHSFMVNLNNGITGFKNLGKYIEGEDIPYEPPSSLELAYSDMSSNNEGIWKVANDISGNIGNMLPSIAVGAITRSPLLGSLTLGASATGNAYAEMRKQGYGEKEAKNYATMVGASEAALQYFLGGIGKLGGKLSGKAVANFISGLDNAYVRVAIQVGGKMASEGLEEAIQTALEPAFKALATGEDFEAAEWSDIMYSALLGSLSSLGLDGAPTMAGTAINSHQANKLYGNNVEDIVNESLEIDPENAHAQRMRSRLDNGKKVGGYQINRLFEANRESLLSQDAKKIKNAALRILGAYGETSDVTKVADVITKFAKGEKLTSKDYNILNESKYGHQVVTEINRENIKSGGLKNKWAEGVGTKLIHPEAYNKGVYDFASQVSAIRKAAEKASVDKMLNENTSESEEKFNVSESGKTIYKDADVNIESVVSVEGGNVKVKLDNGETVSASDLSFSTAEEAAMYNMIARMPVTPDTANELLSAFKPTNSSESLRYMTGVPLAYKFGKFGYEEGLKYIKLSEEQKRTVYNLGRIDAKLEAKTNTPSTTKSKSQNAAPTNKKGIIFEKGVTYDEASANDLQKSSMVVIEAIDAITNLEVHVFESKLENGERVYYLNGKREAAPNGFFRDGNKIYIDLNAGDKGEGAMLYTMAHEVTHYIRKWNAKGFKELADFLIEQYGKKGVPVNALIEEQIAKIKRRYEREEKTLPSEAKLYDMAYEEMVADAMSDMFADEKAFEKLIKLKQQNKSLWKKLGEAIKHLLDKIKATIGLYSKNDTPVAQEAYFVREFAPDVYNKLQDLYLKAFVEADENYGATIGSSDIVGIDTTTESVSPVMLSERTWTESEYVTMRDEAANKIAKALGVTKAKALKYIDDVNSIAKMIANSANGEKILYEIHPIKMVEQSGKPDTSTTANRISQDSDSVNSEFSDTDEMHSDRGSNTISNRTLLANALESTAKNDIEKTKLEQYKKKIALIESEQAKLDKIREEAKELRFKKGRIPSETNRLRELDAEATQLKNRISTYDKQLLNLESTTALKNVLEREKTMVRKRTEQKGKEALRRQKEKAAETQRELMTRYQESRQKAVEGRNKTAMRHKIKNVVSDLNKLLLNPTKEQHVPIGLQLVVAEALDAINMDTMNAEERVAYYNELIAKSSDPDEIAMLTKKRDFFEYRDANFKERITALKNTYAEFKESDDPLIRNAHNEAIENLIKNVADEIGNKSLKDMSLAQLEAVYDMYKAVLATVRNSNKMFKEGRQATVSENSESVKTEVREVGGHKDRINKHTKGIKSFTWNLLKPIYALQRIGSKTLTKLFDNVRAGEDTYAVDIYEAREFFQDKDNKYNYSKWDFKKRYSFKDSAGNDFTLSLEQIMSLYAYSKREQADQHLEVGGFVFDDAIEVVEKKLGIPMKYEVNDATPYRLRKEDLETVTSSLTPEQKGFVDEMQTYLSEVMGAKGNEVSLAMYDIKLYNETEYFPLKTSRYFREFDPETSGTPKLRNSGFSKKTVPNAGNPIVLSNFMDVWTSHVNDMSMYHAFVLPLEDFMRVYNYSSTVGGYDSVQQYIKNAYGVQANQYMEKLIQDINGGVISGNLRNGWLKMFNTFKKVTVGASLSTIVQQPTAVIRAMAIINPKYFLGVPFKGSHKKTWNEIKKYAPVAIIKEMGGFDVGSGRQAQDFIRSRTYKGFSKVKGFFTDSSYRDSIFMWGATKADEFGWNTIWKAVKREVASKQNLKPGTEEFFKACGERFTEVVNQTQVYDSVFSRSGHMRDKGDLSKFATSFLGEPTTSFNMIYNAVLQAVRGGSKAQSIRVISSVYASIIGAAAMASLIYALRDDDEDEAYLEKWAEAFGNKLSTEIWIHNMIPYIRDIASILEGWDVERPDMSIFSDIKSSFDKLFEINEEGEFEWKVDFSDPKSVYSAIENFGGSIAAAFGLPLKNIMRDTRGIFNGIEAMFDDIHPKDVGGAFIEGFTGKEKDKSESLYEAIINGDKGRLEVYRESYKSDEAYESAVKSALRENDPRIKEAAKAKHKGDISKYTRIAKDIISEGNFSQDIVVGAINAEINALKKAEAPENDKNEDKDEATSIYKASDISMAFDNGDTALAKEIINDLVDTKVANGMTEKEAKSSLRSSMTSYWKPLYKQAYNSGNASEMARIRQILYSSGLYGTANDVVKSTQNWLKD